MTHYDTLHVPSDAPFETIRASYRALAKQYHPDISEAPDAQEMTMSINEAWAVLSDPTRREAYDLSLSSPSEQDAPTWSDDWGDEVDIEQDPVTAPTPVFARTKHPSVRVRTEVSVWALAAVAHACLAAELLWTQHGAMRWVALLAMTSPLASVRTNTLYPRQRVISLVAPVALAVVAVVMWNWWAVVPGWAASVLLSRVWARGLSSHLLLGSVVDPSELAGGHDLGRMPSSDADVHVEGSVVTEVLNAVPTARLVRNVHGPWTHGIVNGRRVALVTGFWAGPGQWRFANDTLDGPRGSWSNPHWLAKVGEVEAADPGTTAAGFLVGLGGDTDYPTGKVDVVSEPVAAKTIIAFLEAAKPVVDHRTVTQAYRHI